MTDGSQRRGWWLASDGRWYPPQLHRGPAAPATGQAGWWIASDGKWYPPHLHPSVRCGQAATPGPDPARRSFFGRRRLPRLVHAVAIASAVVLVGATAYGATLWVVGLNAGSSGQGRSATVSNVTITAVATPTPSNLLYPDGTGDVVAKITNPNGFPVTITKVKLPKSTVFATGYTTSSLKSTKTGCGTTVTGSDVFWHFATTVSGSSHTLHTPITVAASGQSGDPLTVIFTAGASMGTTASATCEGVYLKMPSLTGVTAYGGGNVTPSSSPITDKWTS